jgi:chromatin assembly factor 1 subunit A
MPMFRDAVRGNDLSKVGLVEVLKKKFSGRTAGMIRATLEACAARVGAKEADKRWVLNDEV